MVLEDIRTKGKDLRPLNNLKVWDPDEVGGVLSFEKENVASDEMMIELRDGRVPDRAELVIMQGFSISHGGIDERAKFTSGLIVTASKGKLCIEVNGEVKTISVGYDGACGLMSYFQTQHNSESIPGFSLILVVKSPDETCEKDLKELVRGLLEDNANGRDSRKSV